MGPIKKIIRGGFMIWRIFFVFVAAFLWTQAGLAQDCILDHIIPYGGGGVYNLDDPQCHLNYNIIGMIYINKPTTINGYGETVNCNISGRILVEYPGTLTLNNISLYAGMGVVFKEGTSGELNDVHIYNIGYPYYCIECYGSNVAFNTVSIETRPVLLSAKIISGDKYNGQYTINNMSFQNILRDYREGDLWGLYVYGKYSIDGDAVSLVTAEDISFQNCQNGIRVTQSSNLDIVSNAAFSSMPPDDGTCIKISNAILRIHNSTFNGGLCGIDAYASSVREISDCTFSNQREKGISASGSGLTLLRNKFDSIPLCVNLNKCDLSMNGDSFHLTKTAYPQNNMGAILITENRFSATNIVITGESNLDSNVFGINLNDIPSAGQLPFTLQNSTITGCPSGVNIFKCAGEAAGMTIENCLHGISVISSPDLTNADQRNLWVTVRNSKFKNCGIHSLSGTGSIVQSEHNQFEQIKNVNGACLTVSKSDLFSHYDTFKITETGSGTRYAIFQNESFNASPPFHPFGNTLRVENASIEGTYMVKAISIQYPIKSTTPNVLIKNCQMSAVSTGLYVQDCPKCTLDTVVMDNLRPGLYWNCQGISAKRSAIEIMNSEMRGIYGSGIGTGTGIEVLSPDIDNMYPLTLKNSVVAKCDYGIRLDYCDLTISDSTLEDFKITGGITRVCQFQSFRNNYRKAPLLLSVTNTDLLLQDDTLATTETLGASPGLIYCNRTYPNSSWRNNIQINRCFLRGIGGSYGVVCSNIGGKDYDSVAISDSEFTGMTWGIHLTNSQGTMERVRIHDLQKAAVAMDIKGMFLQNASDVRVASCTFSNIQNADYSSTPPTGNPAEAINFFNAQGLVSNSDFSWCDLGIQMKKATVQVSQNIFHDMGTSIVSEETPKTTFITENKTYGNPLKSGDGIILIQSSPEIRNNEIISHRIGITCSDQSSPLIKNNEISGSSWNGIDVENNSRPRIVGNYIHHSTEDNIFLSCSDASIEGNYICDGKVNGILCYGSDSQIFWNFIAGNAVVGIGVQMDATTYKPSHPYIIYNTMLNNSVSGVNVGTEMSPSDASYPKVFCHNLIGITDKPIPPSTQPYNPGQWASGVHLRTDDFVMRSNWVFNYRYGLNCVKVNRATMTEQFLIFDSVFTGNQVRGLYIKDTEDISTMIYNCYINNPSQSWNLETLGDVRNIVIHYNWFATADVRHNTSLLPCDATYNYWDDPTGPYDPQTGTGGVTVINVNYIPFLTTPTLVLELLSEYSIENKMLSLDIAEDGLRASLRATLLDNVQNASIMVMRVKNGDQTKPHPSLIGINHYYEILTDSRIALQAPQGITLKLEVPKQDIPGELLSHISKDNLELYKYNPLNNKWEPCPAAVTVTSDYFDFEYTSQPYLPLDGSLGVFIETLPVSFISRPLEQIDFTVKRPPYWTPENYKTPKTINLPVRQPEGTYTLAKIDPDNLIISLGPNTLYRFYAWMNADSDAVITTNSTLFITMRDKPLDFKAQYKTEYTVEAEVSPPETGSLKIVPPEPGLGEYYPEGTKITISEEPSPGFLFDHWEGDVITTDTRHMTSLSLTASQPILLTAFFIDDTGSKTLTVHSQPESNRLIRVKPSGENPTDSRTPFTLNFKLGTKLWLTYICEENITPGCVQSSDDGYTRYRFSYWDGFPIAPSIYVEMVKSQELTVVTVPSYKPVLKSIPADAGRFQFGPGSPEYYEIGWSCWGSIVTLSDCYKYTHYSLRSGDLLSTSSLPWFNFDVQGPTQINAYFEDNKITLLKPAPGTIIHQGDEVWINWSFPCVTQTQATIMIELYRGEVPLVPPISSAEPNDGWFRFVPSLPPANDYRLKLTVNECSNIHTFSGPLIVPGIISSGFMLE